MNKLRTKVVAVLVVLTTLGLGLQTANSQEATKELRELIAAAAKDGLDVALEKTPLKFEESGRETTTIANTLKIHTDWVITVNGKFIEPAKNSTFTIDKFEKKADKSYDFVIQASAPIGGEIWGEIKSVGKTKVDFTSTFKLKVEGVLNPVKPGEWKTKIVKWEGNFDEVELKPDLAGILSGKARQIANDNLNKRKDDLQKKANDALERAANLKI